MNFSHFLKNFFFPIVLAFSPLVLKHGALCEIFREGKGIYETSFKEWITYFQAPWAKVFYILGTQHSHLCSGLSTNKGCHMNL
jgi:hypothetical protein